MGRKGSREDGIKSALELAMERLDKRGEAPQRLSEEKKAALRKVEETLQAGIAEMEIMTDQQLGEAEASGDADKARDLRSGKIAEIGRLRRQAEREKNKIRGEKE